MKNNLKHLIMSLSIWRPFVWIWKTWVFWLNKSLPDGDINNLDEFNQASHYIIKYLGLPFLILSITFLFSFTDLWPFTPHSSDILNDIREIQQHKKW